MMGQTQYFDPLPIRDIPVDAVYHRLKYRSEITSLSEKQRAEIKAAIEEARNLLSMKGALRRLRSQVSEGHYVVLETGDVLKSDKLALFLEGCLEVLLLAATAGGQITTEIGRLMDKGELARAAIFDAVASETTDAALDWLMKYVNQIIRREGKTLMDRRYSPGYGDLGLENQVIFHRLLHLDRIGVNVSSRFILIPEKSVTAVTGITEGTEKGRSNWV